LHQFVGESRRLGIHEEPFARHHEHVTRPCLPPRKYDRCGTTRPRVVIFTKGADVSVRGDSTDGLDNPSSVAGAPAGAIENSPARHSRNQTLGSGVHPRPDLRQATPASRGQIRRYPLYSFCVLMSPAGGGGTPEGVPGVDIRFRVHDILSLIVVISAREKCQSQTVRAPNA
jgi:hypothetical protein